MREVPDAELTTEQASDIVRAAVQLVELARRALGTDSHSLTTRVQAHLQLPSDGDVPNTAFSVPVMEHANLQLALDEFAAAAPTFEVLGLPPDIGHYGGVSLAGMAAGHWHGPGEPSARSYVDVDIGADRPLPCVRRTRAHRTQRTPGGATSVPERAERAGAGGAGRDRGR